jgi:hypothetical protein
VTEGSQIVNTNVRGSDEVVDAAGVAGMQHGDRLGHPESIVSG